MECGQEGWINETSCGNRNTDRDAGLLAVVQKEEIRFEVNKGIYFSVVFRIPATILIIAKEGCENKADMERASRPGYVKE